MKASAKERLRLRIRKARVEDLPHILRLERALVRHDQQFDPTLDPRWSSRVAGHAFFRDRIRGPDGAVWVAEEDGRLVGYLAGGRCEAEDYRRVPPMAEVDCMFVLRSRRGRGIGERLLRRFLSWCADREVGRVRVVACAGNDQAIAFYRRMGFVPYDLVLERDLSDGGWPSLSALTAKRAPQQRRCKSDGVEQDDQSTGRPVEEHRQQ